MARSRALVATLAVAPVGCAEPAPPGGHGAAWPEANLLFHREPRFIGADGAYSIDLGDERVLWLFGDTFVARALDDPHANAAFLRNTIALQTGRDPARAYIRHYWRHVASAHHADELASFFPEPDPTTWLWPAHGVRVDDTLVVFFERLHNEGMPSPWSFVGDGWDARVIADPDREPSAWEPRPALLPPDGGIGEVIGEAVVHRGDDVLVFGTRGDDHAVTVVRFAAADVARGDLSRPERRCDDATFAPDCPGRALFAPGAPEFSVHVDSSGRWVWVASGGFGAAPIVWRTAPGAGGPWSAPATVFRPPEAALDGAFVYAGKAHPELDGDGALVVTYVPSAFDDAPAALDGIYYFPFFARVWVDE